MPPRGQNAPDERREFTKAVTLRQRREGAEGIRAFDGAEKD